MTTSRVLSAAVALGLLAACGGVKQKADKKFYEEASYNEAADLYKQALGEAKGTKAAAINAQIGEAYRMSNRPAMAVPFYKAAIEGGDKTDSVKYNYAVSLKDAGDLDGAKAQFADYATSGRRQKWVERAKMEEKNIGMLPQLAGKGAEFEVMNVDAINTPASEYSPYLVSNGDEMAYTASRSSKIYKQNGLPFTDIYHVKLSDLTTGGAAVTPTAYDKFNTEDRHEASITISKDGKMAIFARSNDGSRKGSKDIDLFMSRMNKEGSWSDPEMLSISSETAWDASPTLSQDGKSLYFASNREGGKGGIDLYRSTLDANGRWGKVTNLGSDINTAGDEMFPDITEDGKLYFSSDGHPGFGGLDLFMATRNQDKGTTVENLGQPVNSKADDFGITFKNAYEGYFTSNRDGGKGDDDIYYFKNTVLEPKVVRLHLVGTVGGRLSGKEEGPLAGAKVRLMEDGKPAGEAVTDDQGKFTMNVSEDKNYTVLIEKDGYFTKRDAVSTAGKVPDRKTLKKENDINVEYSNALDKIKVNAVIVVENIYYDYNKSDIRTDAATELDKVVTMLNDNPAITIELSSHTDSRGDDKYNQKLSQARAESAVKYIESKGIADARISAKGYGEAKPIIKNAATEDDYQKNRRTEFKVTKVDK